MENVETPENENTDKMLVENVDSASVEQEPHSVLPLVITLIGIFCYIGVILPSVFESSSGVFDYTAFDMVLLVGGAVLVTLGAYFWLKAKVKTIKGEGAKTV